LIDLEQFLETVTLNYSLDVFSELGASAQFAFVECSFAVVYSCTIVWRTLRKWQSVTWLARVRSCFAWDQLHHA